MKKILLLAIVLFVLQIPSARASQNITAPLQPGQQQQGWYDWSKQNLKKMGNFARLGAGGVTGLSGASLLGLRYAGQYLEPDMDKLLSLLAGSPVFAYILMARGFIPYWLFGHNDTTENARNTLKAFLDNPNALKAYAPYLLGTSAALLAAPYLYGKYKQYRQESEQQAELIKKIDAVSDRLLTDYSYQQSRLGKLTEEQIAEQIKAKKKPLMNIIMQKEQGLLTDEQFDTSMTELLGSFQSYPMTMEERFLRRIMRGF